MFHYSKDPASRQKQRLCQSMPKSFLTFNYSILSVLSRINSQAGLAERKNQFPWEEVWGWENIAEISNHGAEQFFYRVTMDFCCVRIAPA